MGKLQGFESKASAGIEEEEATWLLQKACKCLADGDLQISLSLLARAHRLDPASRGLTEIMAVAEVCHAASFVEDACSCGRRQLPHVSPNWYQILKVNEKSDMNTIKKRYRQLALLLHPDKNKHIRAEEAFKLVSEAYAHLSDNSKRAAFDLYLKRRQCKKCSSMTRLQTDTQDTRCSKRSLKGKNHTTHGLYFSSYFHRAEWKLEHERLRIFRQRAQAKVDTLAQILKERRSRWKEEMDNIKGRHHKRTVGGDTRKYIQEDHNRESRVYSYSKKRNAFKENGSDSILIAEYQTLVSQRAELSLLEELQGRKSIETQTPEVLRRLDELLVALKEEIGANGCASRKAERTKLHDPKQFVTGKENMKDGFVRSSPIKNSRSDGKLKDDELTVIDDFLAGLQCDNQTEAINTDCKSSTSPAYTKRNDSRISGTDVSKELPPFVTDTKPCDIKRTAKENVDPSVVTRSHWRLPLFNEEMNDCDVSRINDTEEDALENQKKKSEQLMRTLERLREETKSVAATLESLKEHAAADANHVNGFFNGSCIIAM